MCYDTRVNRPPAMCATAFKTAYRRGGAKEKMEVVILHQSN